MISFVAGKDVLRKIIVAGLALIACLVVLPGISSVSDMQADLRALTIDSNPSNFYADFLGQSTGYIFEEVPSVAFKKHEFWRCLILDPGSEEHHFLIAVPPARDKALVVTDSISAFNKVFSEESLRLSDEYQATLIAKESLLLMRPYYRRFIVISSAEELRGYGDASGISVFPLHMYKKNEGVFSGKAVILVGVDLVERTITLSQAGGVSFVDKVLAQKFAQPSTPHE